MHPRLAFFAGLAFLALGACVPMDQLPPGSVPGASSASATSDQSFPDLDASATTVSGVHFVARAYSESDARAILASADNTYSQVLNDTGLFSSVGSLNFRIVIYRDQNDYQTKTHQLSSSRVVASSTTLYTYPGPDIDAPLAHQITHLIFGAYMGDKTSSYRWLNEGLAMYEELSKLSPADRAAFQGNQVNVLRTNKVPFSQMTFFVPNNEDQRMTDPWYAQVESVVAFMLSQGTAQNFAGFLNDLKRGLDIDRAITDNYNTKFHSMSDVETAWKATVGG